MTLPAVNPNTCSSTRSERLARFFNKKEITLPAGSPCNEFKGYCDVFMKCRLVDADGPLARLKKAIFNPELYENIAEWIVVRAWSVTAETGLATVVSQTCFPLFFPPQAHWWAVLLMGIALIMLMAGFIKICSVHTPSSNPKLPPPKPLPGQIHQVSSKLNSLNFTRTERSRVRRTTLDLGHVGLSLACLASRWRCVGSARKRIKKTINEAKYSWQQRACRSARCH